MTDTKIEINSSNPRIDIYFEFMDEDLAKFIRKTKKIDQTVVKVS
jgi:hypothetical protein